MSYLEYSPTIRINFSEAENSFKTIGDVSAEIGVPPHVLRFWESKFLDIKPHKRKGGHRYYSKKDVETIYEIKRLLYDQGFTIKGAQKKLREKNQMQQIDSSEQPSLFRPFVNKPTSKKENIIAEPETNLNLFDKIDNKAEIPQETEKQVENKADPKIIKSFLDELESIKNILS